MLTGQNAAAAMAISDSAAWSETVLPLGESVVANTVLSIRQLADNAGGTASGREMEAAVTAGSKRGTTGSESHEGEDVLHGLERKRETCYVGL